MLGLTPIQQVSRMEAYVRVEKKKEDAPIQENEVCGFEQTLVLRCSALIDK